MKAVGIIGGLGPETTAEFYLDLIFNCQKRNTLQRAPVIISSVPLPFLIEKEGLLLNKGVERNIPYLINEAQRLERAGADFIVMPCNSLHIFIKEIRASVKIPALSIIEETIKYIQKKKVIKAGIISTAMTVKNKLYENELLKNEILFAGPSVKEQSELDKIIYNIVKGDKNQADSEFLMQIIENLNKENVECILLACTDLQLLRPKHHSLEIFDTMQILAESTVDFMLAT
jgi:aspartate racemase